MPFTPAHTAIVLPLINRRKFSATALIAGSVAPDFEYFFKMSVNSEHSHTLPGLLYFNLPVVFFLSFVFHLVVKRNLLQNSPAFIQSRFYPLLQLNFGRYIRQNLWVFISSALLGAASHIFWDGFTHGKGFFVQHLWFYPGRYVPFDGVNYPLWYALQYISTAVGLVIVTLYIVVKKPVDHTQHYKPGWLYWLVFAIVGLVVFALRFWIAPHDFMLGNAVVTFISSICIALIVCGFLPQRPFINHTGIESIHAV